MSVARYSYINAKIRALKADLLTPEQWDALIGARDMLAALRILDATGYATLVQEFDAETSSSEVERALQEDFSYVITEIINDTPISAQNIMTWISRKFQKEVVKTVLRLRVTDVDRTTAERLLVPLAPFTMETLLTLLDASDLWALASRLPDPFFQNLVEETLPRYEEVGELAVMEHTLDSVVFQNLYKQTQQLTGLDRLATLQLVGLEIDLINLMITLRTQFLGIPSAEAENLLLEIEYQLPRAFCQTAMQATTLEERVKILQQSQYSELIAKSWEAYDLYRSLRPFENAFHQRIRSNSLDAMLGYPFHLGVILGYLNLKWYETLNLKALLHGKADDVEPHIIRRTLIL